MFVHLTANRHFLMPAVLILFTVLFFAVGAEAQTPHGIAIDQKFMLDFGQEVSIPVTKTAGSIDMDGFDILIGFDTDKLHLADVLPGIMFDDPDGWEYFEYRTDSFTGCDSTCPSGMVRVVGVYDIDDGQTPVNQAIADGEALFNLQFVTTTDTTCIYALVNFLWLDCGDNAIAYGGDGNLALSDRVYEVGPFEITDTSASFPTYLGAPSECFVTSPKPNPIRFIDFYNGGLDLISLDDIDDRGDVNLNGVAYEIADFVVFSNYLIYGLLAFTVNAEAQVAASDINADGIPLTFQDLIYLLRVIEGEALPYPSPDKAGEDNLTGYFNFVGTDTSVIVKSNGQDSLGGVYLKFYAPDIVSEDDYEIVMLPDIEYMDAWYDTSGMYLNILIFGFGNYGMPGDTSACIPAGPVDILELIYTGDRPTISHVSASGYLGEYVNLTVDFDNYVCGDVNGDQKVNLLDIIVIINYLYKQGGSPLPSDAADVDGSGNINVLDIAYLVNYLYKSGPPLNCL